MLPVSLKQENRFIPEGQLLYAAPSKGTCLDIHFQPVASLAGIWGGF